MTKRIFVVLLTVALLACGAKRTEISPRPTTLEDYSIGEVREAGIGEPIFDVRSGLIRPGFRVTQTFDPDASDLPALQEGTTLFAFEQFEEDGRFLVRNDQFDRNDALVVSPDGTLTPGYYSLRLGAMYSEGDIGWPEGLLAPGKFIEEGEDAFRAEMIYSGMSGQTIRTVYREYSGDFIRPAFTQELQYDLSQDSTIAYKSIEIEVLEASNSQLRYRVIEDDGLPWLPSYSG